MIWNPSQGYLGTTPSIIPRINPVQIVFKYMPGTGQCRSIFTRKKKYVQIPLCSRWMSAVTPR